MALAGGRSRFGPLAARHNVGVPVGLAAELLLQKATSTTAHNPWSSAATGLAAVRSSRISRL